MKVYGEYTVDAYANHHVRNHLGGDRDTRRSYTSILSRVAEVGDNCCNAACGRSPKSVDGEQQLHQIVVRRLAGALQYENVLASNILVELNGDLTIGEFSNFGAA